MKTLLVHLLRVAVVLCPVVFAAADWPEFRGPGGVGVALESGLPAKWSAAQGVQWKTELPGFGASSPIVMGGRVYVACYSGYGLSQDSPGDPGKLVRHIACFELSSGKRLWLASFDSAGEEEGYEGFLALHGYASSTPITDGQAVYAFLGRDGVVAVTLDGKKKWQTGVGTGTDGWGSATSPLLYKNLVIVNASVESSSLVAVDKETGREVWRAAGIKRSWSTPALVEAPGGATEVVVSGQGDLLAFDPVTGKQLWRCQGVQDYVCPSVIAHDGVVYAIGGRKNTAIAVKAGGRGDVTDTHRLWTIAKGSNVSSPVWHGGHLYWVSESKGSAYCVKADTGEVVYEERIDPRPDRIYASPIVADGKIYVVSREKGVFVLAAEPQYQLVAVNEPLDSSIFNATPAIADGRILLRSDKFLYCLKN